MPLARGGPYHGQTIDPKFFESGFAVFTDLGDSKIGYRYEAGQDPKMWDFVGKVIRPDPTPAAPTDGPWLPGVGTPARDAVEQYGEKALGWLDKTIAAGPAGIAPQGVCLGPDQDADRLREVRNARLPSGPNVYQYRGSMAGSRALTPGGTGWMREFRNPDTGYEWREYDVRHNDQPTPVRVILNPGVYLVGRTALVDEGVNDFLLDHQIESYRTTVQPVDGQPFMRGSDGELLIELGGRMCYWSFDKPRPGGLDAFLNNIMAEGHGSVFEHPHYTFILSGVSRNLTLEANRHRPFSISQLSGRYVDGSIVGFVADPDALEDENGARLWAGECYGALRSYQAKYQRNYALRVNKARAKACEAAGNLRPTMAELAAVKLDRKTDTLCVKRARERARDILPGCLETRVMYTINTRAIRFVMERRCAPDAAFEIRRAFNGVFRVLSRLEPKLFADMTTEPMDDGTFAVVAKYPKI